MEGEGRNGGRGEEWRERGGMEGEGRNGGRGEEWRERGGMEGEGGESESEEYLNIISYNKFAHTTAQLTNLLGH